MTTASPWLDFEGPPAQHHVWNNNGLYGPTGQRRLAMNGSQPCLMVMPGDPMHHDQAFHHFYHHHMHHPAIDIPGFEGDYIHAPMFHEGMPLPEVHGPPSSRFAGSQPCLFIGSETGPSFAQTPQPSDTQPRRKSSKSSAQRPSRLKRSESFSVPGQWGDLPPPPPPVPQHLIREESKLQTPSLSPLAVVRNKRASQVC